MIESIKNRIWEKLKEKDVSMVMLYDREGRILWHRGRKIKGKTVHDGESFSKTHIRKTLESEGFIKEDDVLITLSGESLPYSARVLYIRSLLILPVAPGYFLYIDSGIKDGFSPEDCEIFKLMGQMLGDTIAAIRDNRDSDGGFSGTSKASGFLREQVIKYAIEEEPVLLLGETGVGKNHVAEMIHRNSGRKGRFVVVHTPSIPESLFESELFGHKKGAFTGAGENKTGLVKEAEGGTLFLDEIAETPLSFQAKLLQLIDVRKYRVLGDSSEKNADIRIVAATNRDLREEIKQQRFRKDLFYRLSILPIEIPPLRERKEDIPEIVNRYRAYLKGKTTDESFRQVLYRHDWPGNVRELINLLKRAGIHLPGPVIGNEIQTIIQNSGHEESYSTEGIKRLQEEIGKGENFWNTIWQAFLDREISRPDVLEFLSESYTQNGCNLKRMSRSLNIEEKDYPRFVSALHKYQIHPKMSD